MTPLIKNTATMSGMPMAMLVVTQTGGVEGTRRTHVRKFLQSTRQALGKRMDVRTVISLSTI